MRFLLAVLFSALLLSPSLGASCSFVNTVGDRLTFIEDGNNTVLIEDDTPPTDVCSWATTPDGPAFQAISCQSGRVAGFFFGYSVRGGTDRDLLLFDDDVWYRECDDT
jgi:hypothetical protein